MAVPDNRRTSQRQAPHGGLATVPQQKIRMSKRPGSRVGLILRKSFKVDTTPDRPGSGDFDLRSRFRPAAGHAVCAENSDGRRLPPRIAIVGSAGLAEPPAAVA